jgi:hypothetical protein
MTYSSTRGPLAICLAVFGVALMALFGYLVYRTVSEYVLTVLHVFSMYRRNVLLSNVVHSCSTQGAALNVFFGRDHGDVVAISDYKIAITSGGPLNGTTDVCTIATRCTKYYYSYMALYCDEWALPTSPFACYTNKDYPTPQCVEPGNSWVASLVGCIIAGVSGISFLVFAWCLKSDIKRRPSQPIYPEVVVEEPVYVTVAQPATVVPGGRVVQGTAINA